MRILGLIAGYAVTFLLTGWLQLRSTVVSHRHEQGSSYSLVELSWSRSLPSNTKDVRPSNDTTGYFSSWHLLPVGLVRYPDFGTFDFLKNGD
ncbi:hypothetical protein SAMN03080617_02336 [Algoriphagus alkaliphilus]|uniref:Uncharacterized protein n=1 Tax=Algoriphagus alkaliphilus TaxID=279824 RepID=A0A1G5Y925_9BACT|nr:hypothetical protein [Algoriphagus alkaliphilus]SDA79218.1 hypothetical protein SAMN03080617_02336 [Algoriphagus alkaliphilus]